MADLSYMPLFIDDYEAATAHLTLEEDGAYTRLMRLCWRTPGGTIPDDNDWIRRRMRVDQETFDRLVLPLIDEFFSRRGGRVFQKRLLKEYEYATRLSSARKEAGKKGAEAKSRKTKQIEASKPKLLPPASPKQTESPAYDLPDVCQKQNDDFAQAPIPIPIPIYITFANAQDADGVSGEISDHLWKHGPPALVALGMAEKQARSTIGMWQKSWAENLEALDLAIAAAVEKGTRDPVAYVNAILQREVAWIDEAFDQFWAAYPDSPHKTDRDMTRRLFASIVTGRRTGIPKADPKTIIAAARSLSGEDPNFIPAPYRWLSGERWQKPGAAANGKHPFEGHPKLGKLDPNSPTFRNTVDAYLAGHPDEAKALDWRFSA